MNFFHSTTHRWLALHKRDYDQLSIVVEEVHVQWKIKSTLFTLFLQLVRPPIVLQKS